ncbi:MAG: DUF4388 domain-containing protein [Myxococcota bacterium]|nr:DUF4388 domain-containing protein [Myxococcota bacterium]
MSRLALRFISGKYKGGEYALSETEKILIGRSSEIDLVLMEDMVSRKHARLWIEEGKLHLEDLGSTNGTFVNGEKVSKTVVDQGDRILIGTSIMKVVESNTHPRQTEAGPVPTPHQPETSVSKTTMHASRSMTGTIREIPLPDLIQLLSTSKKTGTLIINKYDLVAKIHFNGGRIIYASVDDSPGLNPLKAMFRILSWDDGTFELCGPEPRNFPETIDMPTEHILMDGLTQLDELRNMENKLPPLDSELVVVTPLLSRLADLNANELDVFQLVHNYGTMREVLDRSPVTNTEAADIVVDLISRDYITRV